MTTKFLNSLASVLTAAAAGACASTSTHAASPAGWWSPAPSMLHARSAHAVVSTGDAIYAIGGTGEGGQPVLEVERFDGNQWRDATRLPGEGLNAPAAAVIGRRIYVIGGFKTATNVPSSDVLVYDIDAHSWSTAASLAEPRGGHAAAVVDGRIHVIGGRHPPATFPHYSEFEPATKPRAGGPPNIPPEGRPAARAFKRHALFNRRLMRP